MEGRLGSKLLRNLNIDSSPRSRMSHNKNTSYLTNELKERINHRTDSKPRNPREKVYRSVDTQNYEERPTQKPVL